MFHEYQREWRFYTDLQEMELFNRASGWLQNGSLVIEVEAKPWWPCVLWTTLQDPNLDDGDMRPWIPRSYDWKSMTYTLYEFNCPAPSSAAGSEGQSISYARDEARSLSYNTWKARRDDAERKSCHSMNREQVAPDAAPH